MRHLILVALLFACGGKKEDKPVDKPADKPVGTPAERPATPPTPPPGGAQPAGPTKVTFAAARKEGVRIGCRSGCDGDLYADEAGQLAIKVTGPTGTKVQLQGQELVLGAQPSDLTLDGLYYGLVGMERVRIPVRAVSADGKESMLELEIAPRELVSRLFAKIASGPIRLPREGKAKYEADVLVQISDAGVLTPVTAEEGSPAMYQTDFIELSKTSKRDETPCKYQVAYGDKAGAERIVSRSSTSLTSTVYNRRTGKVVATRTFGAIVKPCPKETQAGTSLDAIYDDDAYRAWLKTFVKKQAEDVEEDPYPAPTVGGAPAPAAPTSAVAIPSVDEVRKRFGKVGKEDKDDVHRDKDSNDDTMTINGKRGADQVMVQIYDIGSTTPKEEPKPKVQVTPTYAVKVAWHTSPGDEFELPRALEIATSKGPWANVQALDDAFKAAGYTTENNVAPSASAGIQWWPPRNYAPKSGAKVTVTVYNYTKPEPGAVVAASGTRVLYVRAPRTEIAQQLLGELTKP